MAKSGDVIYRATLVEPPEGSSCRRPYSVVNEHYPKTSIGDLFVQGSAQRAAQRLAKDLAGTRGMSGALEISVKIVKKPKIR